MPAFTLTQLRDKVLRLGDRSNSLRYTEAGGEGQLFLDESINQALAEMYDLVDDTFQGYYDKVANVVTVAGTQTVSLPSDFYDLRALDRDLGSNSYTSLRRLQLIQTNRYSGQGTPVGYSLFGGTAPGTIRLWPIPDAVYTLRVTYAPIFSAMAAGSDSFDFRNGWEQYVITRACLSIDQREDQPIGERQAVLAAIRMRIVGSAAKRNIAEPEYLVPRSPWDSDDGVPP